MSSDKKDKKVKDDKASRGSDHSSQGKASFKEGSTVQGGSDYGQGSSNLGPESYKQGQVKNDGSNYENERKPLPDTNNNQDIENGMENKEEYTGPNKKSPDTE